MYRHNLLELLRKWINKEREVKEEYKHKSIFDCTAPVIAWSQHECL